MRDILASVVAGRVVYDLGAGSGGHGKKRGASRVICVDKSTPWVMPRGVEFIRSYINEVALPDDLDVVFLGWPVQYGMPGLHLWLEKAKTIIYLGCNFGGTACGTKPLFQYLLMRRLAYHLPDHRNTLLVVEEPLGEGITREPTPEEAAALSGQVVAYPGASTLRENPSWTSTVIS